MEALEYLTGILDFADPCRAMAKVVSGPIDDWQRDFLTSTDVLTLCMASRGTGKSSTAAVDAHVFADSHPGVTVILIAPALRQAEELFRSVKFARVYLTVSGGIKRETQQILEYDNGSRVICIPATEASVRGFRAHRVYVDEAARLPDEAWTAIIPMLLASGRLIAITTPAGRRGKFYEWWQAGKGKQIIAKSLDIPRMAKIVERDRKLMSDSEFRTEHALLFAGSGDAYFNFETIDQSFVDVPAMGFAMLGSH